MEEREKYEVIYAHPDRWPRYGHTNHGRRAVPLIPEGARRLLDVGCGWNEFARGCRERGLEAVGVDFACPGADVQAAADALPYALKEWDVVTSFDMLEHCRPEEVERVLAELARVSRAFIFSISYVESVNRVRGQTLHPTVRPREWWMARIAEAGGKVRVQGHYLTGEWTGERQARPFAVGATVCLVGNGPGVLERELGEEIEAHDVVVRFNAYRVRGYEARVGRRTDLWSTFGEGMVPGDAEERPQRVLYIHGENGDPALPWRELWRVPMSFFNALRARVRALSEAAGMPAERLARVIPSSGMLVCEYLRQVYEPGRISLVGFDHFSKQRSGRHHYWNRQSFGRPPEHDGDAEAVLLGERVRAGEVRYLGVDS